MTTGISSRVLWRAINSLQGRAAHQYRSVSQLPVVGSGFYPNVSQNEMFQRAASKANAANQSLSTAPNHKDLSKLLFSSSSPSENNKLDNMWKSSTSSNSRPAAGVPKPLTARPVNTTQTQPSARRINGSAVVSLCSTGSFQDSPELIDLTESNPSLSAPRINNVTSSVYLSEGDFSDDDTLDFEAPCALPAVPRNQPAPVACNDDPPPATNISTLSWSQSSPSHFAQPKPRQEPAPRIPKRSSDGGIPAEKLVKKRQLPATWTRRQNKDEALEELYEVPAHPPPKPKVPWNQSTSDLKAQRKQQQQKAQQKLPDTTPEEMIKAMRSRNSKNVAIHLSNEQEYIKNLVVEKGKSVFFTGPAGTGKSVLMRAIIEELKKKYARSPERLSVTASTGLAACNIGGITLHSFAGIGLGKEDVQHLVTKIRRNPKAKERWLKTKILIIDEISMVDGDLFDKLCEIACKIRNNGRPWGGIQLVITGDFFQLPPVPDGGKQATSKFAFDADKWTTSIDHTIGLTEVFRQKDPGRWNS